MRDPASAWNDEYSRQGIPSSHRDEPSGVFSWALANTPYLTSRPLESAVDLGCGTGRNTIALADRGLRKVSGLDFATSALDTARSRPGAERIDFIQADLTKPLPLEDGAFDLATDIFVYFHQLSDVDRSNYRREIHRVLRPEGLLLVSLATEGDGYYSSCSVGPLNKIASSVRLAWDPVAEVGNILLSYDSVLAEFADLFDFQMSWLKRKPGNMHGREYLRETVATLWRARK